MYMREGMAGKLDNQPEIKLKNKKKVCKCYLAVLWQDLETSLLFICTEPNLHHLRVVTAASLPTITRHWSILRLNVVF